MTRDAAVGGVTGRTHPTGSGPCVWYQIFEYATAFWLQKIAEDRLGSVLCAPGCFSLFKLEALKDVIEEYSTDVTCASEFLTKDMGEDRWLCTLLIQKGWRLEYCALSEDKTHCPETFDELYKQRRRWTVSTFANMILLMKDYKKLKQIPAVFLIYQGINLFSALFGPSTVILIVAGGLQMAWNLSPALTMVVQSIACLMFGLVCLNMEGKHQLSIARGMTMVYNILMTAVAVGTMQSIVNEISGSQKKSGLSIDIPVSATTIYVASLVGIFLLTSREEREMTRLFYGVLYFLGIPSGFLILTIYSLCNITDTGWGTREQRKVLLEETSLLTLFKTKLLVGSQWVYGKLQECKKERKPDHPYDEESFTTTRDETAHHEAVHNALNQSRHPHKAQLVELRNAWLQWMLVSNIIGMIFIATLASHGDLTVLGVNAIGFILVVMYIFLFLIQFISMLFHRGHTMIHKFARKPIFPEECKGSWCSCCRSQTEEDDETTPLLVVN